ncbi:calcium-binding protein [Actinomadura sp. NBRC 104425]|uniref:SMP-30/gluconolactonase/LRE family protein n=1 Tax=Actinomadura sp. NBRC 104425 TaxID=3032204 RepID=UPI0024A2895D|nr:SMP-30/gluconolactonase/LRE family protein [Actinomadura sp. NBRC 104425]GLZ12214.1 calcium-binding protein [Actinomadura sp. NBRC 104425]
MTVLDGPWTAVEGAGPWELGEGLRATADGLVAVDLLAGRLYRLEPTVLVARLPFPLGAVAPVEAADGWNGWIAAAGTGIALLPATGADQDVRWLARPEDGAPTAMRMNDGAADPHGRFWAGSMAYDGTRGAGTLYRVDRDGTVTAAMGGLTIPNGPAFTADGRTMYLADSALGVIYRIPVDPASGALGEREVFARVPDGEPDGMTVDGEGCLWSAVWGAAQVHRYAPSGERLAVLPVPAEQPTSVCLTPEPPYRVVLTTARYGLGDRPEDAADGRVLAAPTSVPGRPAAPFRFTPPGR